MISLEDIMAMWQKDSVVDEMNLDGASIDTAKIHAKYLELHSIYKLRLKKQEFEFKKLLKDKFLYYNGKMSQARMDELGWNYDPLDGLKILKGEMDYYYDSDDHIQEAQAKIEMTKNTIDTLHDILDVLKWRHQHIRNAIEWRKFMSGA